MPFLALNGYPIPALADGRRTLLREEVGSSERTARGAYSRTRRALKRRWAFETRRLNQEEALLLRALIEGSGIGLAYDGDRSSSNGLDNGGTAITEAATMVPAIAADGFPVTGAAKFIKTYNRSPQAQVAGSVAIDASSTNLLPVDARTANLTAAFTAIDGAVLALQTNASRWQGTTSVSVTTSGVVNGVRGGARTNAIAGTAATTYTGSVYVRRNATSGAVAVRAFLRDVTNGVDSAVQTATVSADAWLRFEDLSLTTGALATTLQLHVLEDVADSAISFFVDGFQVEQKNYSTAWADGVGPNGGLGYSGGAVHGFLDMTVNLWATRPDLTLAPPGRVLFNARTSPTPPFGLFRLDIPGGGPNTLLFRTVDAAAAYDTQISAAGVMPAAGFFMVTAIMQRSPAVGRSKLELYVNGVLVASANPAAVAPLDRIDVMSVGCDASGIVEWSGAYIDDVSVLPWVPSPTMITAWYNGGAGVPLANWPRLIATGDFAPGEEVLVEGVVAELPHQQFAESGAWQVGAQALSFELWEV